MVETLIISFLKGVVGAFFFWLWLVVRDVKNQTKQLRATVAELQAKQELAERSQEEKIKAIQTTTARLSTKVGLQNG